MCVVMSLYSSNKICISVRCVQVFPQYVGFPQIHIRFIECYLCLNSLCSQTHARKCICYLIRSSDNLFPILMFVVSLYSSDKIYIIVRCVLVFPQYVGFSQIHRMPSLSQLFVCTNTNSKVDVRALNPAHSHQNIEEIIKQHKYMSHWLITKNAPTQNKPHINQ